MPSFGVAFYPGYGLDDQTYLQAATASGVRRFFTSLHITELDPRPMAESLADAVRALGEGAQVFADVSPRAFRVLGASPQNLEPFARLGLRGLRVDYGYSLCEITTMAANSYGMTIVLNASTVEPLSLRGALPVEQVELWHNFYPRPETGLPWEWMVERSRQLQILGYQVGAFIPWMPEARPPLREGLPTVERHRRISTTRAAAELLACGVVDTILLGDPCTDREVLASLRLMVEENVIPIRVKMNRLLRQEEQLVVEKVHQTRPDPSACVVRSAASRSMAAVGGGFEPRECEPRPSGTVTIDNNSYQRYAGELQITLVDLPADPRVNVIGRVIPDDRTLVTMLQPGARFRLVAVEESEAQRTGSNGQQA